MALINCPKCGEKVSDRAAKCIHCGSVLKITEASQQIKPNTENIQNTSGSIRTSQYGSSNLTTVQNSTAPDNDGNSSSLLNGNNMLKKSAGKKKAIIVAVTGIAIVIAIVLIILLNKDKDSDEDSKVAKNDIVTTETQENSSNNATLAYQVLKELYPMINEYMGKVSSAWEFSIYDGDDVRYLDTGISSFSRKTGLNKSEVEKAVNDIIEVIKSNSAENMQALMTDTLFISYIFPDASYCILIVYTIYNNNGFIDGTDKLFNDVKDYIKEIDDSDKHYNELKELYTTLLNYWEFAKSPSGSYANLSSNIQNYKNDIDTIISSLSFDLE